jgi:hypothetical protein
VFNGPIVGAFAVVVLAVFNASNAAGIAGVTEVFAVGNPVGNPAGFVVGNPAGFVMGNPVGVAAAILVVGAVVIVGVVVVVVFAVGVFVFNAPTKLAFVVSTLAAGVLVNEFNVPAN